MATVQKIYEEMQRMAPLELAESWDNPGLLVDCGGEVRRVLVTLDITPEVVAEAAAKQCTVIVAHHPVIFDPLKRLCPADVPYQLVRAGISAICMHTNLDAAEGGVNDVLADLFGIRQRTAFADGCGRVGEIDPITVPELAALAQHKLAVLCNAPDTGAAVQVKFADTGKPVRRLAVISGAGGIPGGSIFLLFMVLANMGLDDAQTAMIVALAIGINPLLDMFETACNVAGDNVCNYIGEMERMRKSGIQKRN